MITKMKTKIMAKGIFAVIFILAALAFVSADVSVSVSNDLTKSVDQTILTLTNTGNSSVIVTLDIQDIEDEDGNELGLTYPASSISIPASSSTNVTVSYTEDADDIFLGDYESTIKVLQGTTVLSSSSKIRFINSYCEDGDILNSDGEGLLISRIKDLEKENEDQWEWKPLDNIEVEVEVKRVSDYQEDNDVDIVIAYGLYDPETGDFIEEWEQTFTIDEDDDKDEFILNFQVPAKNLDNEDLQFYVKAYDDDEDEEDICADHSGDDYFKDVEINKEKNDILIDDILVPSQLLCGVPADIQMTVYNSGKNDEDKVRVIGRISELGIEKDFIINALDEGENKKILLDFTIPETAEKGTYSLEIEAEFDYDGSNYDLNFVADEIDVTVEGNCKSVQSGRIIIDPNTAIQSGGKAGEELIVKASLQNAGSQVTSYSITASGFESWASLSDIQEKIITLQPGQSEDVFIYLDVSRDASGEQSFLIRASTADGSNIDQPVTVEIQEKGSLFTGLSIADSLGDNWYLWGIGLLNVVLIVIIVIVALKIAKS
jgi:uncharacterized membrane protein